MAAAAAVAVVVVVEVDVAGSVEPVVIAELAFVVSDESFVVAGPE